MTTGDGRLRQFAFLSAVLRRRRSSLGGPEIPEPLVEYQGVGELVALFGPGYVEPISESSDIEISARPDFVLRKGRFPDPGYTPEAVDNASDRNRAMLAVTIQEGLYGVAAPGMRWDIRLALAWTRVTIPHENSFLRLAFQWPLHEHPHPFRLLAWSHEWSELVRSIQSSPEERLERIAYAWMFYQAKWLGGDIGKARGPLETTKISCDNWKLLMNVKLPMSLIKGRNRPKYLDWRTQTLPLLARPEIGLPPPLQEILLSPVNGGTSVEGRRDQLGWLKDQRRRLVTDAIIAAGEEEGRPAENAENEKRVDGIVKELEKQHKGSARRCVPMVEGRRREFARNPRRAGNVTIDTNALEDRLYADALAADLRIPERFFALEYEGGLERY